MLPRGLAQPTVREQQPPPQLLGSKFGVQLQPLGTIAKHRDWNRGDDAVNFPRRGASQRSSIANSSKVSSEFSHAVGPKVRMRNDLCES